MPELESEQHEDKDEEEDGVPEDSEEVGPGDKTEKIGDACKSSDESTEGEDSTNTPVFTVSESSQDDHKDEEDKDPRRMEYVQFHVSIAVKKKDQISHEYMGESTKGEIEKSCNSKREREKFASMICSGTNALVDITIKKIKEEVSHY